jgi:hypothetical protein
VVDGRGVSGFFVDVRYGGWLWSMVLCDHCFSSPRPLFGAVARYVPQYVSCHCVAGARSDLAPIRLPYACWNVPA